MLFNLRRKHSFHPAAFLFFPHHPILTPPPRSPSLVPIPHPALEQARRETSMSSFFDDEIDANANCDVVPLITCEGDSYVVDEDTLSWIQEHTAPFSVVSCAGRYRTGKSFLLNRLSCSEAGKGFKVGDTVQACTKGIWVYKKWCKGESVDLLFMDTEGISALDADDTHDVRIFTLSLLLSSVFLYNSTGALDETTMQTLSLMSKVTSTVKMRSSTTGDGVGMDVSAHMPHFYWVLRDFSLRLVDKNGAQMTPNAYLEEALQSGASSKDGIRAAIRSFFPTRSLVTLCRPNDDSFGGHQNKKKTQTTSKQFSSQVAIFRSLLLKEAPPFCDRSRPVSGGMYAALCRHLAKVVEGDAIPIMQDSWSLMAEVRAHEAHGESETLFRTEVSALSKMAKAELRCRLAQIQEACMSKFKEQILADTDPEFLKNAVEKLSDSLSRLAAECESRLVINVEDEAMQQIFLLKQFIMELDQDITIDAIDPAVEKAQNHMLLLGGAPAVKEFNSILCDHLRTWTRSCGASDRAKLHMSCQESESLKRRISILEGDAEAQKENSDIPDEKDITIQSIREHLNLVQTKLEEAESFKTLLSSELYNLELEFDMSWREREAALDEEKQKRASHGFDEDFTEETQTSTRERQEWEAARQTMVADMTRHELEIANLQKEKECMGSQLNAAVDLQSQIEERWRSGLEDVKSCFEQRLETERQKVSEKEAEVSKFKDRLSHTDKQLLHAKDEMSKLSELNSVELEQMRKSMQSQRELSEASQKRVIEIHTSMVEAIKDGEKRLRDVQVENVKEKERLTKKLIEAGFEKERIGDALSNSKKRILDLDAIQLEAKRLKTKSESDKILIVRMESENENLKKTVCEISQEREKLRSEAMNMQGTIALLKAENELLIAKKNFEGEKQKSV